MYLRSSLVATALLLSREPRISWTFSTYNNEK